LIPKADQICEDMTRFDDIGVGFFRGVLGGSLVCFSIAREGVLIFSRRIRAR
jgi:hypothetical protein